MRCRSIYHKVHTRFPFHHVRAPCIERSHTIPWGGRLRINSLPLLSFSHHIHLIDGARACWKGSSSLVSSPLYQIVCHRVFNNSVVAPRCNAAGALYSTHEHYTDQSRSVSRSVSIVSLRSISTLLAPYRTMAHYIVRKMSFSSSARYSHFLIAPLTSLQETLMEHLPDRSARSGGSLTPRTCTKNTYWSMT